MPQFDCYSFYEQVSSALVVFLGFYFFFVKIYFVNFSKTLKMRLKLKSIYEKIDYKTSKLMVESLLL